MKKVISYIFAIALGAIAMLIYMHKPPKTKKEPIYVDNNSLYYHAKFRYNTQRDEYERKLDSISEDVLQKVIQDYVWDEALYREALRKGLGDQDSIVRAWLIQKMEIMVQGLAYVPVELSDEELKEHYDSNLNDYYIEPTLSFAHVYFDQNNKNLQDALYKSRLEREDLNQNDIPFDEAHGRGDTFKYHTYYNKRTLSYIDHHFGEGFAEQLQNQGLSNQHWVGPFQSNKGYHVIMLVDRGSGRQPTFEEVKDSVKADVHGMHLEKLKTAAIQDIIDSYEVIIDPNIR
ncbi:hypothetical protein BFP72_10945 [Reichenbachiella sp. 5M10]|uniref:peptidylprolyl isomerase n=1 Tax=Reichenbachiella sp. 5M10 TaxID=1889772 RepID=UPI000C14A04A|nr:peptidylprolyl isomerase [Reichenbachiella sp. 5M10]PIB35874.1 hypothetical protein BFP72_10945 [Reichenbachiella sp. 5M10]